MYFGLQGHITSPSPAALNQAWEIDTIFNSTIIVSTMQCYML